MKNILIISSLLLTLLACSKAEETPVESQPAAGDLIQFSPEQLKTMEYSTTKLQSQNMDVNIKLSGKVDAAPSDVISVTSALGGYVKKINILPGANFSKGQILGVLEDNQFIQLQQDYLTTQVHLKTAELNYERQKELNQSKAASDKTMQLAEAEYRTLKVAQKALEEKLRLIHLDPKTVSTENIRSSINIYAPFNGTVSQILVNTGKYVSPSETLFELINPSGLLLNIKAFEKDLSALQTGQELFYSTNENPAARWQARIISIGKTINEDGSTDVLARPSSGKLTMGMYINAEISTQNRKAHVLPEASVVMFENKWYVFEQLPNRKFKILEIQPGSKHKGFVEIINSETLTDKIIVEKGAYTLLMGLKNKGEE
jgi:cobalt-zinc-cadmium efflux system membrane fusion protein